MYNNYITEYCLNTTIELSVLLKFATKFWKTFHLQASEVIRMFELACL